MKKHHIADIGLIGSLLALFILTGCTYGFSNIAKNRTALASSNYDYNLTAQLAVDGIITEEEPNLISVCTKDGELPKREKEWTIDNGPYSNNILPGADNFLEYKWSRQSFLPKYLRITGNVAYVEAGNHEWEIVCSSNGLGIGKAGGKDLPGKQTRAMTVNDPNKISEQVKYPARSFIIEIPLNTSTAISDLKLSFSMKNAFCWKIFALDLSDKPFSNNTDFNHYYSKDSRGFNLLPSQVFSSAWMSADATPQWIMVDLGEKTKFNRIQLHWIHKPAICKVETSKDGLAWQSLAAFPENDGLVQEIAVKARARYVRFLMEGADESGHFCLSEIEIFGKSRKEKDAKWKLQRASLVEADGKDISGEGYQTGGWLPAVVPGTVLFSYMAAGAVPDIAISDNNQQVSESFFNSDFWYRGELETEGSVGNRRLLVFDGINWKAEVYMNGFYVGRIDGAFKQAEFDVTEIAGDRNIVAVKVIKNANYGAVKEKNSESPDFNGGLLGADNPTFHSTVGWDWIPTVRGREVGIWNDVRLVRSGEVRIAHPLVQSKVGPDGKADISASVEVTNLSQDTVSGTLNGGIGDIRFSKELTLEPGKTGTVNFTPGECSGLRGCNLALWWPNGMGEPRLHDAWYSFGDAARIEYKAGIREFTYADVMTDLKIFVNDHRFFPKGGNWGFSEINLRFGEKEYDMAVGNHKEMNLNMIRNWVGQTGDDEFYQACDKYGIVVWQDFWLANPADGPDPDDEGMFVDNAQNYLRRIRQHPCIGLYCGRNEGYPPASLNEKLVQTVSELHSDIVYIPNSADDGVSGHGPYRAVNPDSYFSMPAVKFHSERGMPNIMTYSSLRKTFSDENIWPIGDVWGQHDFTRTGAQGDETFVRMVREAFGDGVMESAEKFAHYAQWINYDGYRAMYEANNAGGKGLLIWMSHSCWPSLAWQTYDYWFDRGGAFFGTKKGCEPLHIQLNPLSHSVQVCNYRTCEADSLVAEISLTDAVGQEKYCQSATLSLGENEIKDAIDCSDITDGPCVVTLTLKDAEGSVISENVYLRNYVNGENTGSYTELPEEVVEKVLAKALKQGS